LAEVPGGPASAGAGGGGARGRRGARAAAGRPGPGARRGGRGPPAGRRGRAARRRGARAPRARGGGGRAGRRRRAGPARPPRLGALLARHGGEVEQVIAAVYRALDLPPDADVEQVRRAAATDPDLDEAALLDAARALATGNDRDVACAATIAECLAADVDERLRRWAEYECLFLTRSREPRKRERVSNACAGASAAAAALAAELERPVRWVEREKAAGVAERTAALLRIGAAVLEAYDRRKRHAAALDFDDLIACSRRLLERTGMAAWVQY